MPANPPNPAASFVPDLTRDLRAFAAVCEETLALACREHQALAENGHYEPFRVSPFEKRLAWATRLCHGWHQTLAFALAAKQPG